MDFTSRSDNEAFVSSAENFLGISSPFIRSAVKLYM